MTISPVRGLIWCHGEDDVLATTLPQNIEHLASLLVVTHPDDRATQLLCRDFLSRRVRCLVTDDPPNRRHPLETGIAMLGRETWTTVMRPTILLPAGGLPTGAFRRNFLHRARGGGETDFFLFHCNDPAVAYIRPWFSHKQANPILTFVRRWPASKCTYLPLPVSSLVGAQ